MRKRRPGPRPLATSTPKFAVMSTVASGSSGHVSVISSARGWPSPGRPGVETEHQSK